MSIITERSVDMSIRTDLAIEGEEFVNKNKILPVNKQIKRTEKTEITSIDIDSVELSAKIGKPCGKYITVEMSEFSTDSEILDDRFISLKNEISALLPKGEGAVLVAGIGNEEITPDAVGPLCARSIFSTRHIDKKLASQAGFEHLNPVCALATGVLGQTGIETGEIIRSVADAIKPKAVIVVDALACASIQRLGRTVQLTDTGITPGSGVGNSRAEISKSTLGLPVIAIGVPTVVDAETIVKNLTGESETIKSDSENMIVTPREIDVLVQKAAKLIALSINCALQPEIEPELLLSVI